MTTPRPPEPAALLDADIADALTDAIGDDAAPAPALGRIRHRLFERIAGTEQRHLTVQAADDSWQPFQTGVKIKVLHEQDGVMSYLLRLAPGAVLPAHRHPIDEECVVLEGSVSIGADLVVPAGGFHLAHRDALHAPISTVSGATIFLRGACPHPSQLV